MEKVLMKVQELEEVLIRRIDEEDERVAKNTETIKSNEELSVKLQAQEKDLNSRESAVKDIESVVDLRNEASVLNEQAKDTLQGVRKEKEKINQINKDAMDEQEAIKKENALTLTRNEESTKDLKKGWEQLNIEKSEYKEKVKADITKNLG